MARVYVSSTFQDLQRCRAAVRRALQRLDQVDVAMETQVADGGRPLDRCLAGMARCDLYLGIFAWRYGHVPAGQNLSITELEYREALRLGKPVLVFLLGEDAPWPRSLMDVGEGAVRIERLRAELRERHLCCWFSDPASLASEVTAAVARWLAEHRPGGVGEAAAHRLLEAVRGSRPPGVLPTVWNLGPRNPAFVGRDATLAMLRKRLRPGRAAVVQALHGLGGVGKTQVAVEYAYRYAGSYELAWWVNAEEAGLVGEQYAALAAELGLTAPHADTASAAGALRAHLRGHGRWLLVFDNAESPEDLRDWLPAGPGHILVTSRNPGWEGLAARIEVDVLSRAESATLIQTVRPGVDATEAGRLAEALGDLPLALAQASGFLAETGMPVGRYLGLLGAHPVELLGGNSPHDHPRTLAAAVGVSTALLAEVDPAALGLVRLSAFLAPEPIPSDLLTGHVPAAGPGWPAELAAVAAAAASPVAAHRSLGRAGRYGLARVDGRGLQLHRLTQAILRDQLPDGQAAAYRDYAQALLAAADPGDYEDPTTWPGWARILPHLLASDPATSPSPDLRALACHAVRYLFNRGDSRLARDLADDLHRRWRERLGPDGRHTLQVASTLVRVLANLGPYSQARDLGEDTLARSRRAFGDDHPDTLVAALHLAVCLYEAGEAERARQLNTDTLARWRRLPGEHFDAQRTAHHLGRDLRALGEAEAARRLHEDSLAYRRRVLGDAHPQTLHTANELGASLRAVGEIEAARRLHEQTLACARRALGREHPIAIGAGMHLARDVHALGDVEQARRLGEDTLARARRVLGDDSHLAVDTANDLAACLHALGEHEAARQLGEDLLARSRRVFGYDHPRTLRAADTLTAALRSLAGAGAGAGAGTAGRGISGPVRETEPQ